MQLVVDRNVGAVGQDDCLYSGTVVDFLATNFDGFIGVGLDATHVGGFQRGHAGQAAGVVVEKDEGGLTVYVFHEFALGQRNGFINIQRILKRLDEILQVVQYSRWQLGFFMINRD